MGGQALSDAFDVETNANLGAVEIGTFLSLVLLGVSLSQGYTFFRRSSQDGRPLKIMVGVYRLPHIRSFIRISNSLYLGYDPSVLG